MKMTSLPNALCMAHGICLADCWSRQAPPLINPRPPNQAGLCRATPKPQVIQASCCVAAPCYHLGMKANETKLQSVIEGAKQYVVPLFQRKYSWDTKEWNTLWDDLVELYEETKPRSHFI